jgi:ATP phosphoribosyltransferase
MDNINMTDEQIKQMTSLLADELVKRIYGVANDDPRNEMIWHCDREDDEAVGELARLMTLLNLYEDREEYEKCHLVNQHIKRLEKIVEIL